MEANHPRQIKSFVLRQGRLTKGQEAALETGWPRYGLEEAKGLLDFQAIFANQAPVILEIGFGNGESLAQMAVASPDHNFLGIEVHTPGVGHLLHLIEKHQLNNMRVMNTDAVEIIQQRIPAASLARVQIYFPDPWHKKRHNKRRIIQSDFVSLLATRLKTGGLLHLATDWQDYAESMAEVLQASQDFVSLNPNGEPFSPRPDFRPLTKFEQRGLRLGMGV
ncbi:MAG TPA: tRNA (guanosine(46)-N7)-methyltransferase TrmB, partial [Thiolinea sp.]|nr:tRNA (guanosine(46)-N7)-methyltransferase TrmB [Thiolinea sp.]